MSKSSLEHQPNLYRSSKGLIRGENDLATVSPQLVKEWHKTRNKNLTPSDVTFGSHKKVWWRCENDHEWRAEVKNRVKGSGCPYCSGRCAEVGVSDLATLHPELVLEWDYIKNSDITPQQLASRSNRKVWWRCALGHSFCSSVDKRTSQHRGCPYCSNQKVLVGYNDFASQHPQLATEWNYEKNDFTPEEMIAGSGKKVWWRCKKGHEWQATAASRVRGNGCPYCAKERRTSFPEQAIYFYIKQFCKDAINGYRDHKQGVSEIDIYMPHERIGIEYDGRFYHTDATRDKRKEHKLRENGIELYRVCELLPKDVKKGFYVCDNVIFYDPTDLAQLDMVILYLVQKILRVAISENVIDIERDRTKIWDAYIVTEKENSLENRYPTIAKEWHSTKNGKLKPSMAIFGSGKKVWWKCLKCGHEWQTRIVNRTTSGGTGCPECMWKTIAEKNSRLIVGENDLETMNPELLTEWCKTRNGALQPSQVYYKSTKVQVWWKCSKCGYEWQAIPRNRTVLKTGCRKCSYIRSNKPLSVTHPQLLEEWDYEKNAVKPEDVVAGSHTRVYWKCEKGHSWLARIAHRANGTRCPYCLKKQ